MINKSLFVKKKKKTLLLIKEHYQEIEKNLQNDIKYLQIIYIYV